MPEETRCPWTRRWCPRRRSRTAGGPAGGLAAGAAEVWTRCPWTRRWCPRCRSRTPDRWRSAPPAPEDDAPLEDWPLVPLEEVWPPVPEDDAPVEVSPLVPEDDALPVDAPAVPEVPLEDA